MTARGIHRDGKVRVKQKGEFGPTAFDHRPGIEAASDKPLFRDMAVRTYLDAIPDRAAGRIVEEREDSIKSQIDTLLGDPSLTNSDRRRIVNKMAREEAIRRRRLDEQIKQLEERKAFVQLRAEAIRRVVDWTYGPMVFERANGSLMPEFYRYMTKPHKYIEPIDFQGWIETIEAAQVITVQHDWAAAFSKAKDFDGGHFRLPYDVCCFEFQLSGRRVLAFATETGPHENADIVMRFVVNGDDMWHKTDSCIRYSAGHWSWDQNEEMRGPDLIITAQVKAICIALEANVAVSEQRTNTYRIFQNGQPTKQLAHYEFHVLNLSRAHSTIKRGDGEPSGQKRRLHFRRGHYRHYPNYRIYIEWMLVGDPDLGFIDKEYRI